MKWINNIHERIDAKRIAYIEHEDYCILHNKTIEKQISQNLLYSTLKTDFII
jgi:hypothetical protein